MSPGCGGADPAGEVVRLRRMTAAATSRRRGRILEEPVRQEGECRGRAEPPAGTDAEEPEKRGPGTARGTGRRIPPRRSLERWDEAAPPMKMSPWGRARMAQIGRPPPWRLAVEVDLSRATTTAARVEATPSVLHGERGEGDEVFLRRRISTRSDATRRMKQGRPPVRIQGEFHHDSLMLDYDGGGSG